MELGKFLAALADEMSDRELPLWISHYIIDLIEAALEHMKEAEFAARKPKKEDRVMGLPVSGGKVMGKAYVVSDENPLEKAPADSIVVMEHATSEISEYLGNFQAVVTDQGGRLSHLATVAREMGKPAVVGTGNATRLIKTGDTIVVDANEGIVTKSF